MKYVWVIVAGGTGIMLVASSYAGHLNPQETWPVPLLALAFPWLFLGNLVLLVLLLVAYRQLAWIPLVSLLLAWPTLNWSCNWTNHHHKVLPDSCLKVVTYNVRNFDLYDWQRQGVQLEKILELIAHEQPDIACLQEFFNADTGRFQTVRRMMGQCGFSYYAVDKTVERPGYGYWGLATFSRFPIVRSESVHFPDSTFNSLLITQVQTPLGPLHVINMHLQSFAFDYPDYAYIEQLGSLQNFDWQPAKTILARMHRGYQMRPRQVHALIDKMRHITGPLIVCGDMNDTPSSYSYRQLRKHLNDTFLTAGPMGWGSTYTNIIPMLRIDYIFINKMLSAYRFRISNRKLGDHSLVSCYVRLATAPQPH